MNIDNLFYFFFCHVEHPNVIVNTSVEDTISIQIKANACKWIFVGNSPDLLFGTLLPYSHHTIITNTS